MTLWTSAQGRAPVHLTRPQHSNPPWATTAQTYSSSTLKTSIRRRASLGSLPYFPRGNPRKPRAKLSFRAYLELCPTVWGDFFLRPRYPLQVSILIPVQNPVRHRARRI